MRPTMKMRQSAVLLVGAVVLAARPFAAAPPSPGVVFELEVRENGATEPTASITAAVEGQNLKMQSGALGEGDMIFRGDRREMTVVNHSNRSYLVLDEATLQSLAEQMNAAMQQMEAMMANMPEAQRAQMEQMMRARGMGPAPAPTTRELRRTGERATHSGFATERYDYLVDGRKTRELWVTPWSNIEGEAEARPAFEAMAAFAKEMLSAIATGPLAGMADSNGFELLSDVDGFPVLTREFDDAGQVETETLLRSARQQTIDPAEFEPPAGYTRQQMMGR